MSSWSFDREKYKDVPNDRERSWEVELYPDDPSHAYAIECFDRYNCVGILHDKDVKTDGTPVKPHHYRLYFFKNAKFRYALAEELHITPNYVNKIKKDKKAACLYSIHYNDQDKYQYPLEEVYAGRDIVRQYMQGLVSESEKVLKIIEYLDSHDCYVHMRPIVIWSCENGYYDALRRGGRIVEKLIKEHNMLYSTFDSNGNPIIPF